MLREWGIDPRGRAAAMVYDFIYGMAVYVDDRAALLQLRHAVYFAAFELRDDHDAAAGGPVSLVRHAAGDPLEYGARRAQQNARGGRPHL